MPTNLYEADNGFRLYDVEGVVLPAPNDFALIREPDQFKDSGIKLKRDNKSHGFDYEFSDSESPYGFDGVHYPGETFSPREILLGIYSAKGVDGKAILRFYRNAVLQYEGNLDFKTLKLIDYKITITSRRINLDDLFRTRFDTPVNFGATTSIDGTPIGGITPDSMFMHSKQILYEQNARATSSGTPIDFGSDSEINYVQFDNNTDINLLTVGDEYSGAIHRNFTGEANTFLYEGNETELSSNFTFKNTSGVLSINGQLDYTLVLYTFGATTVTHLGSFASVNGQAVQLAPSQGTFTTGGSIISAEIDVSFNETMYIPKDGIFRMYDIWIIPKSATLTQSWAVSVNANASVSPYKFEATFTSYNENSFSDVYSTFDAFNHILEVINNGNNLLISDFWSNVANDIYVSDGYKIRGLTTRNVITDFKSLFEKWAQPSFGLGFAVVNDLGTFKVLMERYEHFYQDVEIDHITAIEDDSFEVSIDKDIIFNEVVAGYKDFPKSTDENKNNNIDAFNTQQTLLTPLETVKKKASYISDVIGDGFKIENQRREQFKEVPEDTVSDDTKVFALKGRTQNNYTGLTMSFTGGVIDVDATYLNLSVGDVITIAGTTSNNGNFTIDEITLDLSGNTFFRVGVRLDVAEAITTELNVSGVTLTKAAVFLRAERDEAFDVLTGVQNPKTVYNAGLNPKYMAYNQSVLLNSGFNPKPETAVIKTQDVKLNGDMSCKFKIGEGGYILDPEKETVTMDGDILLRDFNSYNRLFTGALIKFSCSLTYDRVLAIRDACLSQDGVKDYGYITVTTPTGSLLKGFIMSMTYNPVKEHTEFVLRQQYSATGGALDELLDFPTT